MAEAIARATAERSSLSGGVGAFCRAAPVRAGRVRGFLPTHNREPYDTLLYVLSNIMSL